MTVSIYSQLKRQVIFSVTASSGHESILSSLKDFYKDKINSPRRFEQVTTIGQLLTILEIRDELSEDNVEPLKHIARRVTNSHELLKQISDYEASHVPRDHGYSFASENHQSSVPVQSTPTRTTYPYMGNLSPKKIQRIHATITEEIGRYWRDLARGLKISEARIQFFDDESDTLAGKAALLMDYYCDQKADPQRWFFNLCQALENARRRDVSTSIQEIMTMNL